MTCSVNLLILQFIDAILHFHQFFPSIMLRSYSNFQDFCHLIAIYTLIRNLGLIFLMILTLIKRIDRLF